MIDPIFKTDISDIATNKARQWRGMIAMHTKAEKAYRQMGDLKNAEQAKALREHAERELEKCAS